MIVCVCRRVSDHEIKRQAQAGCNTFDELQMETGVSTCCGCCTDCARGVFDQAKNMSIGGSGMSRVIPIGAAIPA